MKNKVLLMILDGWGKGENTERNAIFSTAPEYMNSLVAQYPNANLLTSGEDVGLPEGQMGNSEVGHQNIGAGRILYQDLVKINRASKDGSIMQNPEIVAAFEYAKSNGKDVHFMGLVSSGGVHSSLDHLCTLCDISKHYGIENTYVHAFMDGRDTDPKSGAGYLEALETHMAKSTGKIASVIGRYYAMDRDKRWERVREAYDLIVKGVGDGVTDAVKAVEASYVEGVTDEFIKPTAITNAAGEAIGLVKEGDMVIFFNYRNDRAKELTQVLTQCDMPEQDMKMLPLYYCTMTPYDSSFEGLHILFDKDNVVNTLGEYISSQGLSQLRIAETEKFAHVTFFFNGGREKPFEGENRILINSPKVATYDLQPEMSAYEVADALCENIKADAPDFICLNFANCDMVGHTGIYDAIVKAIKTVDECVKQVVTVAKESGYTILICADHGNADNVMNADGTPNTAHSLNPVPLIVVSDTIKEVKDGVLADLAPTILKIMGLNQPKEITGASLV